MPRTKRRGHLWPWPTGRPPRGAQNHSRLFNYSIVQTRAMVFHDFPCGTQDDWQRFDLPMAVWCCSGYTAVFIPAFLVHSGVEAGPALWGAFLGFAVLCGLAAAALFFFAFSLERRPVLVAAKVTSVAVSFGISGFFVALALATSGSPPRTALYWGIPAVSLGVCVTCAPVIYSGERPADSWWETRAGR